ncbi:hypothetical protein J6590_056241 [Homalodisca vitripennis]|nr:hypothetical protein J6590_056241 [Homalodisca vitripennis]
MTPRRGRPRGSCQLSGIPCRPCVRVIVETVSPTLTEHSRQRLAVCQSRAATRSTPGDSLSLRSLCLGPVSLNMRYQRGLSLAFGRLDFAMVLSLCNTPVPGMSQIAPLSPLHT